MAKNNEKNKVVSETVDTIKGVNVLYQQGLDISQVSVNSREDRYDLYRMCDSVIEIIPVAESEAYSVFSSVTATSAGTTLEAVKNDNTIVPSIGSVLIKSEDDVENKLVVHKAYVVTKTNIDECSSIYAIGTVIRKVLTACKLSGDVENGLTLLYFDAEKIPEVCESFFYVDFASVLDYVVSTTWDSSINRDISVVIGMSKRLLDSMNVKDEDDDDDVVFVTDESKKDKKKKKSKDKDKASKEKSKKKKDKDKKKKKKK